MKDQLIRSLFDRGLDVQSRAAGRIGKVVGYLDNGGILVEHPIRGKGVTTFDKGDPVSIIEENGTYYIRNEGND